MRISGVHDTVYEGGDAAPEFVVQAGGAEDDETGWFEVRVLGFEGLKA